MTADGRPIEATFDGAAEREYSLSLSPVIQQGQIVTVSYTDPTPGDDEHALQDAAGNDVATFESVAVTNRSVVTGVTGVTGAPTVSGFAQVGKALAAAIGNIADVDGLPDTFPDDYALQWVRVDADGTSNRTVIAGATSGTYTPDADDLGKRIKVEVSFSDDDGTAEGPLASAATPAVAAAPRACTTGAAWCATLTVGTRPDPGDEAKGYCTPAARPSHCVPAFGALDDDEFSLDSVTYTVESLRWGHIAAKSLHLTLDRDFPSASLAGLTLKVDTHSFALSDATRGNDDDSVDNNYRWSGNLPAALVNHALGLDVTVELLVSDNNFATGAPAISGAARVGETLTAAIGNIADADRLPDTFPDDYTFQWVRVDANGESNAVDIGTDSSTYAPGRGRRGQEDQGAGELY